MIADAQEQSWAPEWVADAVFYQIFPERFFNGDPGNDPPGTRPWGGRPTRGNFFGGDLEGIRRKLGYLADLGVTALYLTPIFAAPSNHKYDTEDYLRVDPHFGDATLLKKLVSEAHAHGIRVILDGVFNHSGDRFFAFRDLVEKGAGSAYRGWYFPQAFPIRKRPAPNYRACGGAAFLPKLNTADPGTREYLYRVARYWIETADIDGWRLDVPWEVPGDFWRGFREVVKGAKPEAYLVGECWGDGSPWLQGDQFDGVMNYRLRELIIRFFIQRAIDAATFDRELGFLRNAYPAAAVPGLLNLLGSHDTPRFLTVCGEDEATVIAPLIFLFTYLGTPMLYYGDEVGMTGGHDPGCRAPMVWDPGGQNRRLYELCRRLAFLRRRHPALRRGRFVTLLCQERTIVYQRVYNDDRLIVALNAGFQEEQVAVSLTSEFDQNLQIGTGAVPSDWQDLLSRRRAQALVGRYEPGRRDTMVPQEGGKAVLKLTLPPRQGVILAPA